jgi:FAD/FMN-containing dehydrogenase
MLPGIPAMSDLAALRAAFSGRLITEPAEMAPFLTDWRKQWRGGARAVVQPDTARDVAAVVRWCAANGAPVVPQGGNTGLSGGSVPTGRDDGIVLSLARLNRVRGVDPLNNTLTVEAGCVLQKVQEAAAEAGRLFPLSLASEGSCTIGGNLSTNAGGTGVLRYGNARELCLGLEVVTAQGELWDGMRSLRKDNTGYDLRDLFIGAEGTLGVITAAVLKLYPAPAARATAFVAVPDPHAALRLFNRARARLGMGLTAFELVSQACLDLVLAHVPDTRSPVETASPWYLLVEVSELADAVRANDQLEAVLGEALEAGEATDAALAASVGQARAMWRLRESISDAQAAEGPNIKHDVAVPISSIADFIDEALAALQARFPAVRPVVFGHLGDGNLHFNVSPPKGEDHEVFKARQGDVNGVVHGLVARRHGSISAEHGLGVLRRDESAALKSPVELALMRAVKQALDPAGLMNPGKVLPQET